MKKKTAMIYQIAHVWIVLRILTINFFYQQLTWFILFLLILIRRVGSIKKKLYVTYLKCELLSNMFKNVSDDW